MARQTKQPDAAHGEKHAHGKRKCKTCGAKTSSGGECRQPAGARTDHLGTGRCWLHGGRNKQKKGNTHAVKHGLTRIDINGRAPSLSVLRPGYQDELDAIADEVERWTEAEMLLGTTKRQIVYLSQCLYALEREYSAITTHDASAVTRSETSQDGATTRKQDIDPGRARERYERARVGLLRRRQESLESYARLKAECQALGLLADTSSPADLVAGLEFGDGTIAPVVIGDGAAMSEIRNSIDVTSRPPSDPDVDPTKS